MSARNLYALTPDEAKRLIQYARAKGTTASNYAADALIPIEMDAAVERAARAAYGPKAWDKLDLRDPMTAVQRSAFMAQIRTALVSAAGDDDE